MRDISLRAIFNNVRQTLKYFWNFISKQERRQFSCWLILTAVLIIFYVVVDGTYPLEKEVIFYLLGAFIIDSLLFLTTWRYSSKIGNALLIFLTLLVVYGAIYYYLLGYTII